jgi:hypothetical protein
MGVPVWWADDISVIFWGLVEIRCWLYRFPCTKALLLLDRLELSICLIFDFPSDTVVSYNISEILSG